MRTPKAGQLHTYVEGRLHRWRVWYHSGKRPGPERVISWWGPWILDRNAHDPDAGQRQQVKVDPTECEETDRAVRALPANVRAAIFEYWLKGGTMEQKTKALHCDKATLYRRIERANVALLGYFNNVDVRKASLGMMQLPVFKPFKKIV